MDAPADETRSESAKQAMAAVLGRQQTHEKLPVTQEIEIFAHATDLLQDVAAGLEHTTRLRDNRFDLDGDATLGVIVDRDRVKRALTNIVDNALRYSPPGAPIHLSWVATDESTIQITVRDQGPGIDPNLLPHIFEPGIRGTPAVGSPDSGAGLGLTIAKRLLEHQHAALTIHNEPTGGALVSLRLRRAP